jgi:hypothetical protein
MSDTVTVRELDAADVTVLYCHYDRQTEPQGCFVSLSLETGRLWASYDPEIGGGIPASVYHQRTLQWPIPRLTAEAANRLLRELVPLAERVLGGAGIEWDGQNRVGELTCPARQAADEIGERCEELLQDAYADSDVITECSAGDWFVHVSREETRREWGITDDSPDADLAAAAAKADREALEIGEPGPVVLYGTESYFRGLREELREKAAHDGK